MSYGIRAALEARRLEPSSTTGWWTIARDIDVDDSRNRLLFAVLAAEPTVLDIEPVAPPRGLPDDVTGSVRAFYEEWGAAAGVTSWVSYAELVTAVERIRMAAASVRDKGTDERKFLTHNTSVSMQAVLAYLAVYQNNGYDTRLVFWFTAI